MGPYSLPVTTAHPELSALATLDAYSKRYDLVITASGRRWTVTGPGLDEPAEIEKYTDLVNWLARRFGGI